MINCAVKIFGSTTSSGKVFWTCLVDKCETYLEIDAYLYIYIFTYLQWFQCTSLDWRNALILQNSILPLYFDRKGAVGHQRAYPVRRSTTAARGFRCLGQLFGTVCRLTLRLSTVCQSFVVVSQIICSCTRIQAPFNNCISFSIVAYRRFLHCTWSS